MTLQPEEETGTNQPTPSAQQTLGSKDQRGKTMSIYAALELLATAAETCEQNAKINEQEGNTDQAALNTTKALECRNALAVLNKLPA